jgi:hypothetical protein
VPSPGELPRARILGVAAQSATDELLWELTARLFDPARFELRALGAEALASEVAEATETDVPHLVCITSCPPGGLAHVRYLCKRLRRKNATLRVVVLRPGTSTEAQAAAQSLADQGVARVTFTVAEAHAVAAQLALMAAAGEGSGLRAAASAS